MKSSKKLNKIKGYHLSIQGKWKGNLFREKWFINGKGIRARGGSLPAYKTCWVPPPPLLGLCQLFGNHVEFTIIKGEPILTVENSYELFFFFPNNTVKRPGVDWHSRDSRFVPWQVFFVFQYGDEKTGAEWQGSSGKGCRCSIFRTEKYFYYHRVSNDRSVLSQSLTILCSVAGISHSRGGDTSL